MKNAKKIVGQNKIVMNFMCVCFSVNVNPAPIDEQIRPASVPAAAAAAATPATTPAGDDKKDGDEKVGLALPIAPLIGLGAHRIGLNKGMNRLIYNLSIWRGISILYGNKMIRLFFVYIPQLHDCCHLVLVFID